MATQAGQRGPLNFHNMKLHFHISSVIEITFFCLVLENSGVESPVDSPAWPRSWQRDANLTAPRSFRPEVFMADRAPVVSPTEQSSTTTTSMKKCEGRGAWVLTAYGISGLALFGVLAYFFSDFIAH